MVREFSPSESQEISSRIQLQEFANLSPPRRFDTLSTLLTTISNPNSRFVFKSDVQRRPDSSRSNADSNDRAGAGSRDSTSGPRKQGVESVGDL